VETILYPAHAPRLADMPATVDVFAGDGTEVCEDTLARPLKDLRLSVIDQCNFRCTYCMPKDIYTKDYPFMESSERLSFDQLVTMARAFVQLGVDKIRITGGEPLLRKNLEKLIERLAGLSTPDGRQVKIAMTTNGALLAAKARALKDAGLDRVTVSLDSQDDAIFKRMNGVGFAVDKVLQGIEAAQAVGLSPIKVNTVVQKGVNDSQIVSLARHFRHTGVNLRFIEFMDVGGIGAWSRTNVITSAEARRMIESAFPLIPHAGGKPASHDTASRFYYTDGAGEIGFISSVSEPFCGSCTRVRVSSDGKMFLCLFANHGVDLRPYLSKSRAPQGLADVIRHHWQRRDNRYSELRSEKDSAAGKKIYPTVRMSLVGG
jgi:cyclic pyranopterin phosphate synthase